jgi:rhomboid family GlyGly-CTERM serine protease
LGLGAATCVLAALPAAAARFAFLRPAVEGGEVWRLLTCHLVHAGPRHLVWNLAGLAFAAVAVGPERPEREWLALSLASALAAGAGVLWWSPETVAMAGLSAILHGLLAAGGWSLARRDEPLGWGLLALLAAKLGLERFAQRGWAESWLGAAIATDAHLFAALGGLAAALLIEAGNLHLAGRSYLDAGSAPPLAALGAGPAKRLR